ncbi:MAG: hypothetical protein ACT4TC_12195 [Myxococcaceae bacterium]
MRPEELADRFEMTDGSSPEATPLAADIAKRLPLGAFTLLTAGDVFEAQGGTPPVDGKAKATAYLQSHLKLDTHGARDELVQLVKTQLARQLEGNPTLPARLKEARPLRVELIPPGHPLWKYGYPKNVSPNAAGLFWDHPSWPAARIAFKQDKLKTEQGLVVHEMAHALMSLAFTEDERDEVYRAKLRTYRRKAAVDEVFAIYTEKEFVTSFTDHDYRAPGVYGQARQRWNEQHVFTRFVRNLYFPYKPLAGGPRL